MADAGLRILAFTAFVTCFAAAGRLNPTSTVLADEASSVATDSAIGDPSSGLTRARGGLMALYDFSAADGSIIKDRAGVEPPIDLRIADEQAVRREEGTLRIVSPTLISSENPATRIIEAVRRTGEFTVEAWIEPAETDQSGPARIVTLSRDGSQRNFTLGQEGARFDVRFRTTGTSTNGIPSLAAQENSVETKLTHIVYTRDRAGRARVYLGGKQNAQQMVSGATTSWDESYRLALANELSNDRSWLGTYHLVAVYGRSLRLEEVQRHFRAGPDAKTESEAVAKAEQQARFFETKIAAIFSRHCLECHDSVNREGELDLSRKAAALAGGASGAVLVAGEPSESLLWEYVKNDDMPADRPPLSKDEKAALREWIESGATWSLAVIDPAIYAHDQRTPAIWLQRLTLDEYIATVRGAVGVDIAEDARRLLPADMRADGFSNTAYNLNIDLGHVEAYAELAGIIVGRMEVKEFAARFSKKRRLEDDEMRDLIAKMGKWILRGPLAEHEVVTYRGISTTVASAGGDFDEAVSFILEAMLQSPRFIYRVENQRGDGTAWPASDYELASRLSYILWGAPPDQELMDAADKGRLQDRAFLETQVERMLDDPRAVERSAQFVYQWLDLARLENLRPNPERFPTWNADLAADMQAETLEFFKEVAWRRKRPLSELLNAQVTYATPRLADHYGLKLDGAAAADGEPSRIDVSDVPSRGGLLTHGSVLTVGGDEASMVARGLFVLKDLLRGSVKDPPPCVDTSPVPTKEGLTQRGIAEQRIANTNCGGCHVKFEPLAFGLEKFDGVGAYHQRDEHGNPLRDDGELLIPGQEQPIEYQSSAELMDRLAASDRVRECLTWKVAQFALGRPPVAEDARTLNAIHQQAQAGGGTYASLITAIVTSDLVQATKTEAAE